MSRQDRPPRCKPIDCGGVAVRQLKCLHARSAGLSRAMTTEDLGNIVCACAFLSHTGRPERTGDDLWMMRFGHWAGSVRSLMRKNFEAKKMAPRLTQGARRRVITPSGCRNRGRGSVSPLQPSRYFTHAFMSRAF